MSSLLMLLDVRVAPVSPLPWGALVLLLVVVFVLAVGFTAGIVVQLIWLKRRQTTEVEVGGHSSKV